MTKNTTSMLEKFDDSKRAVANLMARENITVQVIDGLNTAKFDCERRVLSIPNWLSLTVDQCDVLMSHEIGHALFTDPKFFESAKGKTMRGKATLQRYWNCIEDARIERKIRTAFPGLQRTFFNGYREFHSNGPIFKGTSTGLFNDKTGEEFPVGKMHLVDRINVFYKVGAFMKVPFAPEERVWLNRVDQCASTEQSFDIAKMLYDLAKAERDEEKKQNQDAQGKGKKAQKSANGEETEESDDDGTAGESEEGDTDSDGDGKSADQGDNGEESEDGKLAPSDGEKSDEDADAAATGEEGDGDKDETSPDGAGNANARPDEKDSKSANQGDDESDLGGDTMSDIEDALKQIANKQGADGGFAVRNLLCSPLSDAFVARRTITATAWADACEAKWKSTLPTYPAVLDAFLTTWENEFGATAKQMALEFERRKNARNLQNIKVAKTGKLNVAKLWNYKFSDDLFLRSMSVPQGKSHGVVTLIDGSGSMVSCFGNVLDQTLLFAYFAFQVGIPFEAYMFSDAHDYQHMSTHTELESTGSMCLTVAPGTRLVGLINTSTSRAEFRRQVRNLMALRARYARVRNYDTRASVNNDAYTLGCSMPFASLSGTPLHSGILLAEHHIARMKRVNRLDKTTLILLTDGEDTDGLYYEELGLNVTEWGVRQNGQRFDRLSTAFVIRDTVTKKNFTQIRVDKGRNGATTLRPQENGELTMLLDIITARHETRTIYIFLQGGSSYRRSAHRRGTSTTSGLIELTRAGKSFDGVNWHDMITALDTDGQFVLPADISIADCAIVLRNDSLALTENEFEKMDASNMSQRKIAKEFTKSMTKAVANRKFVNSIVPFLA